MNSLRLLSQYFCQCALLSLPAFIRSGDSIFLRMSRLMQSLSFPLRIRYSELNVSRSARQSGGSSEIVMPRSAAKSSAEIFWLVWVGERISITSLFIIVITEIYEQSRFSVRPRERFFIGGKNLFR